MEALEFWKHTFGRVTVKSARILPYSSPSLMMTGSKMGGVESGSSQVIVIGNLNSKGGPARVTFTQTSVSIQEGDEAISAVRDTQVND